ncbi:unnamed protein product [Larinioides sclopetarius]|uniref:Fibrinogen C-terminal domain-containing protein n=1 Tax=Larinioides sclopetarius TaxID=280406 RepID=A0AAV2AML3_9ARAC
MKVIQRRGQYGNGVDYFNKKWKDYKEGFGNLKKEFWIGNNIVTLLNLFLKFQETKKSTPSPIRVNMRYGWKWSTKTENRRLLSMKTSILKTKELNINYTSLMAVDPGVRDSISNHDGWAFYTSDQPNKSGNDQSTRSGGWWRNGKGTSSLNGLNHYKTGKKDDGPKHQKPMDCAELQENGATESGVYTIYPRNRLASCQSIEVYCDMETDGGGWTVIQRRGQYGNGVDYFNKKWKDYKEGFGNLKKEFWIGNEKIYSITNQGQYAVRMEMENESGKSAFTLYENFWIGDEEAKYKLHISDASGPAGDSCRLHDGWPFYTVDQPNKAADNPSTRSGGWWRNGKETSSLNGLNLYKTGRKEDGPKHEKPMDCAELQENGATESGVYTIYPRNRLASCQSIEVYCDMETDGGGWTVIQRRGQYGNGVDYFNKKWKDYKEGFGNLKKEFWIGNEKIYSITNQGQYAVRLEMEHENGKSAFTLYENFYIEDEGAKYKLHISDGSGPGGDSISNHDGWAFYTVDQSNKSGNDQSTRSGGWWRNGKGTSSLNGLNHYKTGKKDDGINWHAFGGPENSFKATEMKVRPKKFH